MNKKWSIPYLIGGLIIAGFIVFPLAIESRFYLKMITEVLILGIFALSLDLLVGYTGVVSFGHALFFGLGSYVSALTLVRLSFPLSLSMAAGVLVCGLIAWIVGLFSIRSVGVYFAMLTMAFAQMFYAIVMKWTGLTGGSDGLTGVPRPAIGIPGFAELDLSRAINFYYFVLFLAVVAFLFCHRIISSPFGKILLAIRENSERAEFIGYKVNRYRLIIFIIAGSLAGLAGALYAPFLRFVSPENLFWMKSGEVLIMLLLGGMGTLFGPFLGAGIYLLLEDMISSFTEHWMIVLGTIFALLVLLQPEGLAGFFKTKRRFGFLNMGFPLSILWVRSVKKR